MEKQIVERMSVNPKVLTEVLGRNLVENFSIVFAEQVKNAHDANATKITIDLSDMKNKIIISDDGDGVQNEQIAETWLRAGTQYKTDDISTLGGKGIGRLTLFSLGNTVHVSTTKNGITNSFVLNKTDMDTRNSVDEIEVKIDTISSNGKNGTVVTISDVLPEVLEVQNIYRDLSNLTLDNFPVELIAPEFQIPEYIPWEDAIENATLRANFKLSWNEDDTYEFSPKITANFLGESRKLKISDELNTEIKNFLMNNTTTLSQIGDIEVDLSHFYTPQGISTKNGYKYSDNQITKQFLSYNSGINIYRKKFKIFGYGLVDWLDLTENARNSSIKVANSRLAGRIILTDQSEQALPEKSSRESLQHSRSTFVSLKELTLLFIQTLNEQRKEPKIIGGKNINTFKELLIEMQDSLEVTSLSQTPHSKNTDNTEQSSILSKSLNDGDDANRTNEEKLSNSNESHPQTKLRNNFVPRIKLRIPASSKLTTGQNIDLNSFIDYRQSYKNENNEVYEKNELIFTLDEQVMSGANYSKPISGTHTLKVESSDMQATSSMDFIVESSKSKVLNSNSLFPTINGNHYRLERESETDYMRQLLNQIETAWNHGLTFVVAASMRSVIEGQISEFKRFVNQTDSARDSFPSLRGDFEDIASVVTILFSDETLQQQVAEQLDLSRPVSQNLFRSIGDLDNPRQAGTTFKNKLKIGHSGAHDPKSLSIQHIRDLASNTIIYLEITEALMKNYQ